MIQGFVGVMVVGVVSLLLVAALWAIARDAPSAGRDPGMTPLVLVPTRTPTPTVVVGSPTS